MKYYIQVFGCQMNESDAERARTVLAGLGYSPTNHENEANLIMVFACAVRQKAVDRIYGRARRWAEYRKKKPFTTILTGCVLTADAQTLGKMFDVILPIKDLAKLPELMRNTPGLHNDIPSATLDEYFSIPPSFQSSFQAYVPISSGCNKFCSYCAVPLTRGREISRAPNDIIREISDLIMKGYKEITLLGQNVNSYGWDFSGVSINLPKGKVLTYTASPDQALVVKKRQVNNPMNFPQLLKKITEIHGNFWVRFISSHPYDMSDELVQTISEEPKLTPYIHLAVQSGSNSVLKRMNRMYTIEHYRDRIDMIRKYIQSAVISTDIIVGFCGETEKDYQLTESLVRDCRFDMAYIAQYSPRPGNAAFDWTDDVSQADKRDRFDRLNLVSAEVAKQNNEQLIGIRQEVLIERSEKGYSYGKTKGFKNIKISTKKNLTGQFIRVKVKSATAWSLTGGLIEQLK